MSFGPGQFTRYLDTAGAGAWSGVGNSIFGTRNWGSSVMYEPGRVLISGENGDPSFRRAADIQKLIDAAFESSAGDRRAVIG